MAEPSRKVQMILGGAGGLGLAIGQGIGRGIAGDVGAWLGLGIGFASGSLIAYLIVKSVNPQLAFGSQPMQWVGIGLLLGIVPAAICYFGGPTGGVIAFWSMLAVPLTVGVVLAVIKKRNSPAN